jgi:hypothetical protein
MRTVKRIIQEFWLPFLLALSWTFYRVSPAQDDYVSSALANFGSSFVVFSWTIGNVVRIKRQQSVEDSFKSVEKHLSELKVILGPLAIASGELSQRSQDGVAVSPMAREISELAESADIAITTANAKIVETIDELASVQHGPRPKFVWHSTPPSIEARAFSILAAFETVLAVAFYWVAALTFQSSNYLYFYPLTGIIVAPLLLLRSDASVREGVKRAEAYVDGGVTDISGRPLSVWSLRFFLAITTGLAGGGISALLFGYLFDISSVGWLAIPKALFVAYIAAQLGPAITIAIEPRYIGTIGGDRRLLALAVTGGAAAIVLGIFGAGASVLGGIVAFVTVSTLGVLAFLQAPPAVISLRTERRQVGRLDSVQAVRTGLETAPGAFGTFALAVFVGGWLRTVTIRFVATMLHPYLGLKALPENWWRTLFVVDVFQAPELVPGYRREDFFNLSNFLQRFNETDRLVEKYFSVLGFIVLYLPAYLYRMTIKSTFWLYMPLVYFSLPIRNRGEALSDYLWKDPKEWWRRFLMVLTFGCYFLFNFAQLPLKLPEPIGSLLRSIFVIDMHSLKSWQIFSLTSALITLLILICIDRYRMSVRYAKLDPSLSSTNEKFATVIVTMMRIRNVSTTGLLIVAVWYAILWQPSLSNLLSHMLAVIRIFGN